jgi:Ca2+-binding EF-hand superfamily protein
MNDRNKSLLVCLTMLVAIASHASAQSPKTASALLDGWDRNKNGLLERSEIPNEARTKIEALAKRKGLDPRKGLPIKTLLAKDGAQHRKGGKVPDEKRVEKDDSDGATEELDAKQEETNTEDAKKPKTAESGSKGVKSDVKGFGTSGQSKRAKGFGAGPTRLTNTAKPSAAEPSQEKQDKKSGDAEKLQVLARSMMAQHDANKNGRLDKSEWSRLHGNPIASDRNGDGVLTTEELAEHLAGFAAREKEPRTQRKSKVSSRAKKRSSRKTYRFLTPHERLPKGMPDWFTEKDMNEDGQLSLHEYAATLSQTKLNEFVTFDLNNDGLIVPKEYLKATK